MVSGGIDGMVSMVQEVNDFEYILATAMESRF
jgi:hypothetical protein